MSKLLKIALQEFGVEEIVGDRDNPVVVNYFKEAGFSGIKNDETAWCSAFMNAVAKRAGLETSGSLAARSWLNVGTPVTEPKMGDVVIFYRGDPKGWMGHVALFIKETPHFIYCLGGNQSNKVGINKYKKSRLLGYRRLEN